MTKPHWTIEHGIAVLRNAPGQGEEPWRYSLASLEAALTTRRNGRSNYATEERWREDVTLYEDGLGLLKAALPAEPLWPVDNSVLHRASFAARGDSRDMHDAEAHLMLLGHKGNNFPREWSDKPYPFDTQP